MTFIFFGFMGIVVSGLLSKKYHDTADPLEKLVGTIKNRPFGGVVPQWVSWVNVFSFVILIYGIIRLIK